MRNIVRTLQVGKAAYLITIDLARHAARSFGTQQFQRGVLRDPDDVFFLAVEECVALAGGRLSNPQQIVEVRKATRVEYQNMMLPLSFTGMPQPLEHDPARSGGTVTELTGAASGGGIAEGRARVILHPADEIDLDDGDILVCRFTDPSWAPLMAMADALVIDIGGSASHGAVVARELDIAYVIGTADGTRVIGDGDRIRVDGAANRVSVLERAHRTEAPANGHPVDSVPEDALSHNANRTASQRVGGGVYAVGVTRPHRPRVRAAGRVGRRHGLPDGLACGGDPRCTSRSRLFDPPGVYLPVVRPRHRLCAALSSVGRVSPLVSESVLAGSIERCGVGVGVFCSGRAILVMTKSLPA